MLRMENIRGWRVVNNDCVFEVSTNLRKIFNVIALVVVAALSKQTVVDDFVDIQLVQQRIAILRTESITRRAGRGDGYRWK